MVNRRDFSVLNFLRKNSRMTLTDISRHTGIPVSSIFHALQRLDKRIVFKYVSLLSGLTPYRIRVSLFLVSDELLSLVDRLRDEICINALSRLGGISGLHIEAFFRDLKSFYDFRSRIEPFCDRIDEYHVLEAIAEEKKLF